MSDANMAKELHKYIKFKAAKQGVAYELDSQFFASAMAAGIKCFFGAVIEGDRIVEDAADPDLLREWHKMPTGEC